MHEVKKPDTTAAATDTPLHPGTNVHGGFYAGKILINGTLFGLVASSKSLGDLPAKWLDEYIDVPGARSFNDGFANTEAMAEAGSSIAKQVRALAEAGFTDWYIPSRDELEVAYRTLKPTTESNTGYRSGENPSAVPPTHAYTDTMPAQTTAEAFRAGGAEAFEDEWYWSSTQYSRHDAWSQFFGDGYQGSIDKAYEGRARAVRRFKIE